MSVRKSVAQSRSMAVLARTLGMELEMSDVAVEPLYSEEMASLSVPDFMAALPSLDAAYAAKVTGGGGT